MRAANVPTLRQMVQSTVYHQHIGLI